MIRIRFAFFFAMLLLAGCQDGAGTGKREMGAVAPSSGSPEAAGLPPVELPVDPATGRPQNYTGIPGSTPPEATLLTTNTRRMKFRDHVVVVRRLEEGGEMVTVYHRENDNAGDLIKRFEENLIFFAGMYGAHLLLEQGTDSDLRTVSVYDIAAEGGPQLRFKAHHHVHQLAVEDNRLVFYALLPDETATCPIEDPRRGPLEGRPFNEFHYDFNTRESAPTGVRLCLFVE